MKCIFVCKFLFAKLKALVALSGVVGNAELLMVDLYKSKNASKSKLKKKCMCTHVDVIFIIVFSEL
jgi:hypothetical protein